MERGEVIAFEIAVERDLPVGALDRAAAEIGPVGKIHAFEIVEEALEIIVEVERGIGRERHEDHARPFFAGQGTQGEAGLVHVAERGAFGNAQQLAVLAIGPAVILAGEARALAVPFGRHRGAARADVEEGAHLAGLVPHDQHGQAHRVHRLVIARLGQFGGEGQHQRHAAEHQFHLGLPLIRIGIAGGAHARHLLGLIRALVLDVIQHDFGNVADPLAPLGPVVVHGAASPWFIVFPLSHTLPQANALPSWDR
jgi:hypothetical protein